MTCGVSCGVSLAGTLGTNVAGVEVDISPSKRFLTIVADTVVTVFETVRKKESVVVIVLEPEVNIAGWK